MSVASSLPFDRSAPIGPHTIRRATLTNGIRVVVQENHTSPSVVLRGYLWAGSVSDPPEKAGLADFTAAAVRRGSTNRTFQEINEQVESVGANVSLDAGRRLTYFGGKSLAEDLPLLVDILTDLLLHPAFPPHEVEKLRGQTLTHLKELEDDTRHLAERDFRQLLYPDHPYGRPVEGTLESVPLIQRDDLVTFYQTHYTPRDAVIVAGGDVTAEAVFELLEKHLGGWRADGAHAAAEIPPVSPPQEARRYVRTLTNKTQVDIVFGTVGLPRTAPDFYAARVADTILGHMGLMGRLGDTVRDQLGLAYYAYSTLEAGLGPGPWSVSAGVAPEHVERALEAIRTEIVRMRDELVSKQELEDAQDYLTGTLPLRLETNEGITATLLDMELYGLGDDYIIRYPSIIRAVTREEIQAVVRKYLDVERFALAIAGPYRE
ncbi:MAG: insulinase family protein [Anaerolineae bacterium]|nr:insulinase family protein [Anaerolineae bacterium]MDW8071826.1 pitrilysin family protein [Anaerolineae bacterium]